MFIICVGHAELTWHDAHTWQSHASPRGCLCGADVARTCGGPREPMQMPVWCLRGMRVMGWQVMGLGV